MATQGAVAPASITYLDHARASGGASDIGLNDTAASAAYASSDSNVAAMANHLIALADAACPREKNLDELVEAYAGGLTRADRGLHCQCRLFRSAKRTDRGSLPCDEVVLNRASSGRYPPTSAKSSLSPGNSPSCVRAIFRPPIGIRTPGVGPSRWHGLPKPEQADACRATCSGIMPIMSARPGAGDWRATPRSASISSTADASPFRWRASAA